MLALKYSWVLKNITLLRD